MALTQLRPHRLRRLHWRTLVKAVEFAQLSLDDPQVVLAASRFFRRQVANGRDIEQLLVERDCEAHFIPWVLWDAQCRDGGALGRVLAQRARGKETREILSALLQCRPEVWQIASAAGSEAELVRLRDGFAAKINDPVLQAGLSVGDLLIARVADLGDVQLLDAVHDALPQRCAAAMKKAAVRIAKLPPEAMLWQLRRAAYLAVTAPAPAARPKGKAGKQAVQLVFAVADRATVQIQLAQAAAAGSATAQGDGHWLVSPADSTAGHPWRLHWRRGKLVAECAPADHELVRERVQALVPSAHFRLIVHGGGAQGTDDRLWLP